MFPSTYSDPLLLVYQYLDERSDRTKFALISERFLQIAQEGERIKEICDNINRHFRIIQESSTITTVTPLNFIRLEALFLTEFHCSSYHRSLNSSLINLVCQPGRHQVSTEADDDCQIPNVHEWIKIERTCWDLNTDWVESLWRLSFMQCYTTKSFLKCNLRDGFCFEDFLDDYNIFVEVLKELAQDQDFGRFQTFEEIETICNKGSEEEDDLKKRKQVHDLVKQLMLNVRASLNYVNEMLDNHRTSRDKSLVNHVTSTISDRKFPVVVAGENHIFGNIGLAGLCNRRALSCLALKPNHAEIQQTHFDYGSIEDKLAAIKESTNGWSSLLEFIKLYRNCETDRGWEFWVQHKGLVDSLKEKMSHYTADSEHFSLWCGTALFIFEFEYSMLSKELQDLGYKGD